MRVAVLADTHDRLPEKVCEAISGADEIWHLGDVCSDAILARLRPLAPLRVVRGNCDPSRPWPLTLDFMIDGIRFHLEHIPARTVPPCDIFLHGHTHVPRDEMWQGVRWLNPGCITRPNRGAPPAFAWLTIRDGAAEWRPVPLG